MFSIGFARCLLAFGLVGVSLLAQLPDPAIVERGTIVLHFLQQPVGEEKYEIERMADQSLKLTANFEYNERGSKVPLKTTLQLSPAGYVRYFRSEGKSYRPFFVDSEVAIDSGRITQKQFGRETHPDSTRADFTIDGYSPLSVQMMLVRYWKSTGRPARIRALPTGPLSEEVSVEYRGKDLIRLGGTQVLETERYTIRNVTWGRESLWLDAQGRFVAATTFTGGLPFEAVREEYRAHLNQFVQKAVADRMEDSHGLRRDVPFEQPEVLILDGVTLLDLTGRAPQKNSVVIMRNGFIEWVGPRGRSRTPEGSTKVDARKFTVMPGLWDMHAHFSQIEWGPTYLAAGITTARDMGGEFEFLRAMKAALAKDEALGPRLLMSGLVDAEAPGKFGVVTANSAQDATTVVTRYKQAGFDQIKLYTLLRPDVVRALISEAHRLRMTVAGHVPREMKLREVIEAGMDHVAHIGAVAQLLQEPDGIAFLKRHGTVIDPTVSWNELLGRSLDTEVSSFEPGIDKTPFQIASLIRTAGVPAANAEDGARRLSEQLAAIKKLHDGGIPIVAGTDKGVPGHSLHREIELYVKAGLTPMQALQAATIVPARVMKLDPSLGTIEKGKRAELILVEGNPIEDISNIRRVRFTITGGRIYSTADLWESVGFAP